MAQQHKVGTVATTVRRTAAEGLSVIYHATEVVRVRPDGAIILDSGGWRTFTTKTRMNQASNQYGLGFQVFQKAHAWFVQVGDKTRPFTDGIVITVEG